jgi:hypothetical protein
MQAALASERAIGSGDAKQGTLTPQYHGVGTTGCRKRRRNVIRDRVNRGEHSDLAEKMKGPLLM